MALDATFIQLKSSIYTEPSYLRYLTLPRESVLPQFMKAVLIRSLWNVLLQSV